MKVILREDIKNVGRAGETLKVAEGFGRNYLLPKKLAVVATPENLKRLQQELNSKKGQDRRLKKDAEYKAEAIAAQPLRLTAAVGAGGKLFGSITTGDILKELENRGIDMDKRKIVLEEPIKTAGTHQVIIKLHPDVTATLTVIVQGQDIKEEPSGEPYKEEKFSQAEAKVEAEVKTEAEAEVEVEAEPQEPVSPPEEQ